MRVLQGIENYEEVRIPRDIVAREKFTGDGSTKIFQLSGSSNDGFNVTYSKGNWEAADIQVQLPTKITSTSWVDIYDSLVFFSRNKISVLSISSAGVVTLNYAPRNTIEFYVYYYLQLDISDIMSSYERDTIINSMSAGGGGGGSIEVEQAVDESKESIDDQRLDFLYVETLEDSGNTYVGYEDKNGAYFIAKYDSNVDATYTYGTGGIPSTSPASNWTSLSYDSPEATF